LRIVLFMTDGFIGNDSQILGFVQAHLNGSRIFPLGVGSSPNRHLLEELAAMGKGSVRYVRQDEKPSKLENVIEDFYDRIAKPYLTDLTVDWNGLEVLDASPQFVPDLFAGQPVFIHGRYRKPGKATISLRGKLKGKAWGMPLQVELPDRETGHAAMGPLWARGRITDLERRGYAGENKDVSEKITRLALDHKLVSRFTSFVAVDETPTVAKGQKPMIVPVEAPIPEGTNYEGFFGAETRSAAFRTAHAAASVRGSAGFAHLDMSAGVESGRVSRCSKDLLAKPSRALARRLIALQDGGGAFHEPDSSVADAGGQALALLALAKAYSVFGKDMREALERAWAALKARTGSSEGCAETVKKALKDDGLWNDSLAKQYEELAPILKAVKHGG
jgi:hypothetical protein